MNGTSSVQTTALLIGKLIDSGSPRSVVRAWLTSGMTLPSCASLISTGSKATVSAL